MHTIKDILFYNRMFNHPLEVPENLPGHYRITEDQALGASADVIVFHLPNLGEIPYAYKPTGQVWVAWCLESDANYPFLRDQEIMQYFDLKMTYSLDSDIPYTYLHKRYQELLRDPGKAKTKGINAFISSPFNQSKRLEYLKELMEYLKIDSYGKVLNNCKANMDDNSAEFKELLIADYKFTIAFENSISRDYVTEKFFQSLAAGSVPIYLGAPNVEDFAPGDRCFINVNDFACAKDLATYIIRLSENDEQYLEYLKWKYLPFKSSFNRLLEQQKVHPFARLCHALDRFVTSGL